MKILRASRKDAIPEKYQIWTEACKKYHLSQAHIQMARELGLNPKGLGKTANPVQENWKVPLPDFIEDLYFKRFGKRQPDKIRSLD